MLHPAICVRESPIEGMGLYATADIGEGEIIWALDTDSPRYHIDTIRSWPIDKQEMFYRYSMQIDEQWYFGPEQGIVIDPSDYMNHSCDPNAWFTDDKTMTARCLVRQGEEITYDYATSEVDERFVLPCRCGTAKCRKIVRGSDYLLNRVLQAEYGNHVMSHVLRACLRLTEQKGAGGIDSDR